MPYHMVRMGVMELGDYKETYNSCYPSEGNS